jgi:hypothetical protein
VDRLAEQQPRHGNDHGTVSPVLPGTAGRGCRSYGKALRYSSMWENSCG